MMRRWAVVVWLLAADAVGTRAEEPSTRVYFSDQAEHLTELKRCAGSSALVYCRPLVSMAPHQRAFLHLQAWTESTLWSRVRSKATRSRDNRADRVAFIVEPPNLDVRYMNVTCLLELRDPSDNRSVFYANSSATAVVRWYPCTLRQPVELRLCRWNETVELECLRADLALEWTWYRKVPLDSVATSSKGDTSLYDGLFLAASNKLLVHVVGSARLGKYTCYGFDPHWDEFYEKQFVLKLAQPPAAPRHFQLLKTGQTSVWLSWLPDDRPFDDPETDRLYSRKSDWFLVHYQRVGRSDILSYNTTDSQIFLRGLERRAMYRVWLQAGNAASVSPPSRLMVSTDKP